MSLDAAGSSTSDLDGDPIDDILSNPANNEKAALQKELQKPRRIPKKAISLPVIERRNWLIHSHYVRKEYETCKALIAEQLKETNGECEHAAYIQAMILRIEGEIQQSLQLFRSCHRINPHNPDNMKQIAKNLSLLGKHKNAIECYSKAAQLGGEKDWEICHSLGACYQFLKQYDVAEKHFLEAIKRSRHVTSYVMLSKLYLEVEDKAKAREILQKGLQFSAENTELLTTLGLLFLQNEEYHKAFELLGKALTYNPENYKAILGAGSLMQQHGDFDVALTKYRVAAQNIPESSSLWNNIAMCFFGKKKYVAAISCLKRASYLSPFDWKILYNLSLLHLTMQQYASAFQFASTAITLKQDCASLYMLLAVALSNLDQAENAELAYQQAYDLSPMDPNIITNFAIFLHNRSQSKKAAKLISKLSKIIPGNSDVDKEIVDTVKKLSVALNVGDRIVAENDKSMKKSKRNKDKDGKERRKSRKPRKDGTSELNEGESSTSSSLSSLPSQQSLRKSPVPSTVPSVPSPEPGPEPESQESVPA